MTLRSIVAIGTTLLLALLAVIVLIVVYFMSATEVPTAPGNYVVIADGRCEIHLVRASASDAFVLTPSSCEPLVKGTSLSRGLVATTKECGLLTFGPSAVPGDFGAYSCAACAASMFPTTCPFLGKQGGNLLRWERID